MMRLATRITLTMSVLVVLTLGILGMVIQRNQRNERLEAVGRDAAILAAALRASVDVAKFGELDLNERAASLNRGLQRAGLSWRVALLDAHDAPAPGVTLTGNPSFARLGKLLTLRTAIVDENARVNGKPAYVHLEPLKRQGYGPEGYVIVGAIELTHELGEDPVLTEVSDVWPPLGLIALVLVVAVYFTAARSIGRPIKKLIAGIDDVARGDLSHVVLQEREDELGALASRFNEMTASLREAREETRRGAEARSQLELHLRSSEKMATVGSIAAEIAHEVGTPLNVVTGRARAMARKADDPEAVQKNATIIAEQASRITRIIQRLLDFARRRVGDTGPLPLPIDLAELAAGTLEFLEHQLDANRVGAELVKDPGVGPVAGIRDQLQQVLLNLCMNAVQAMPTGGQLSLHLSKVRRRRPGLELAAEQDYVVLSVADTGMGIADEDRDKIFEPFYTSKSATGGSGLGLAVSHSIVKEHDGWIDVLDNVAAGRGTVFKIFLPAA
jgi:signal transduction histidine kinase